MSLILAVLYPTDLIIHKQDKKDFISYSVNIHN